MNTSLHVMEAYANLYRVWPDTRVGERLRNMVVLFLDRIIDTKSGHLVCFFDRSWNPTSRIDSYGHDIEASWLLYEAARLLNDQALRARVQDASIALADAAAQGLQPDGSMLTERDRATGHMNVNISWWEQAETVVGYTNAYQLTGNEGYLDTAIHSWQYIRRHMVDRRNGAWFSSITPEGVRRGDKAGFWICPHHNGRMCLEIMERVSSPERH
jgi:mannobiose 2-epimerase